MAHASEQASVWLIAPIKISADRTLETEITENSMATLKQPVTHANGATDSVYEQTDRMVFTLNAVRNLWLMMLYRNGFTQVEM